MMHADIDLSCDTGLVPQAASDPTLLLTRLNNVINSYTGRSLYTVSCADTPGLHALFATLKQGRLVVNG
jgi:hypothetical protein